MADAAARDPRAVPALLPRRIAAVGLGLLLYIAATPFTPVSWLTQSHWTTVLDGPNIVDRVLSPVLLLGAAALHWYVAGAVQPLPLTVTLPRADGAASTTTHVLGVWLPAFFWPAAALEAALLWALAFSDLVVSELGRRSALVAVVLAVWVLGWNAMPWYRKQQAWGMMKDQVLGLLFMEMADMAGGGRGYRRRRRRL